MKTHVLVTLADENYVEQAKQLFSSAYWNGGWDGDYLLLSYKIPEKKLKWFRKKGIFIFKCKELCKNSAIRNYRSITWTKSVINKFYLFDYSFKRWETLVFLDSDIIVRGSIKKLKEMEGFSAVKDVFPKLKMQWVYPIILDFKEDKLKFKEIKKKFNLNSDSFNSGVMVIDTELIEKNTFLEIINLFEKYKNLAILGEQSILNLFFYKKWNEIPVVYNNSSLHLEKNPSLKSVIIHSNFPPKFWDDKSLFKNEWKENLQKADLIDIKHPIHSVNQFSEKEIMKYSKKIEKINFYINLIKMFDRDMGIFGIWLNKKCPAIYSFLKGIKLKINKLFLSL
jgi:lipopolysaccharide biosynthesis glycosyltransferase